MLTWRERRAADLRYWTDQVRPLMFRWLRCSWRGDRQKFASRGRCIHCGKRLT